MSSKLEMDVRGLLAHCEELANEDSGSDIDSKDWRLKKYIKSLDTMIQELDEQEDRPSEYALEEYRNRCTGLKVLTNFTEPSPRGGAGGRLLKSKWKDATGSAVVQEINQIHTAKYTNALRTELFDGNDGFTVRQRKTEATATSNDNEPANTDDIQEKIAENMLLLAKNLKEQTETANKIIKRDTEAVQASSKMTEKNFGSLKKESEKLQEHSKRAWKCWMWVMIGIVMAIFVFMVMFMKLMKKKV